MKTLQSNWIVLGLLGMLTYLGTTSALLRGLDLQPLEPEEPDPAQVVNTTGPSWEFNNPELDQLIADLKREREHLTEREKQLDELAARLQAEKAEITRVTNAVVQLQRDFDQSVTRLKEEEQVNLKKLAKNGGQKMKAGEFKVPARYLVVLELPGVTLAAARRFRVSWSKIGDRSSR